MAELTPMMRQYMEEKEKHPDSLLFFRLGDFYEMFGPDARTASRELDLALTTRDKDKSKSDEERIPMCGVPYHSAEGYIARLIAKGYKVSICEQMEDPALAKGLVKREIIRTVTPGTVLDEACLDAGRSNYLCGVYLTDTAAGLCAADISTGQAQVTAFTGAQRLTGLINELGRFAPAEAVMNAAAYDDPALTAALEERFSCRRERLAEGRFDVSDAEKKVRMQFGEAALRDLPRNESAPLLALGGLLTYLYETQKTDVKQLDKLEWYRTGQFMELDLTARRNLELTETLRGKEKKGSLLWVLDKTKTPMGARNLRMWLQQPLVNVAAIDRAAECRGGADGQHRGPPGAAAGPDRHGRHGTADEPDRLRHRRSQGPGEPAGGAGAPAGDQAVPDAVPDRGAGKAGRAAGDAGGHQRAHCRRAGRRAAVLRPGGRHDPRGL